MSFTSLHIYALLFSVLPRLLVLAGLPSPLQNQVPVCAQSCLQDFLQQDFDTSICSDSADLDCLCSHYDSDGYTLGERAYACLYTTGCTQASRSNATAIFSVCANRSNAVTPTHKTLLITATPSTMTSSTVSITVVKTTSPTTLSSKATTRSTSSAASATSMSAGATFSAGPDGTKMPGNISLTMAQIAGIAIAAAALLILTVGIACCLIFVRKRNKRLEQEDQKVLIYENSPDSQHNPHVLSAPRKDPRSRTAGVGIIPLQRYSPESQPQPPQQQQRTWPRYYPVVPDERAIEAIVNQFPPRAAPLNNSEKRNDYQDQQNTGITITSPPLPPAQAHSKPSKPPPLKIPQNLQPRKDFSPVSAATDFEEDDPSLRPRSNFAGSRPMSGMDFGEWPKPPVYTTTAAIPSPPRKKRTSRPPTLTIAIPKAVQTVPIPLPLAPQRPPLARHDATKQVPARQWPLPPPSQSQQSSYSSAIASSQALGASIGPGTSQSSERSTSNSRRPSKSSARSDSQASYTSFESMGSDDDPTPPKEEDKRLSPVHESPMSYLRYPKVPRASNQIVPRTPPSHWNRESGVSSLGSPFMGSPGSMTSPNLNLSSRTSPNLNSSPSPVVKQRIGNKLWKTESSPRGTKPQYTTWGTQNSSPMAMSEVGSPGFGVMPRLTPRKRGGDLVLDVSR